MGKADSLSKQLDWQKGVERNNENKTIIRKDKRIRGKR